MHTPNIAATDVADETPAKLLRIQEVAAELGLTTRSIRYYEEIGLLEPAARSDGDYRLYDADDLDRLRCSRTRRPVLATGPASARPTIRPNAGRSSRTR